MDIIALSIPLFFILLGGELLLAWRLKRPLYRFSDSVTDLSCGVSQQLFEVVARASLLGVYVFLYERFRLTDVQPGPLTWTACFIGVDFMYYWFHRFSHQCALAWSFHVVHHQSEDYNLAVALRQDGVQPLLSFVFYLPLAVLGFPPLMYATCSALNTLYQFWIHTRLVRTLGPLELFLNTPSHHRVHHGADPKYLDRNHGGVFILWDRMFGTFQREEEEPTYGVTEQLTTWNPLMAHLHYPAALFRKVQSMPGGWNKLMAVFRDPGWMPRGMEQPPKTVRGRARFDVRAPLPMRVHVTVQFVGFLLATVSLLFGAATMGLLEKWTWVGFLLLTMGSLGGLLDGRAWARGVERVRLVVMMVVPLLLWPAPVMAAGIVLGAVGLLLSTRWSRTSQPATQQV